MTNHNESYISTQWPGFRVLWWVVGIILFIVLLILWLLGYGPGGQECCGTTSVQAPEQIAVAVDRTSPVITLNNAPEMNLALGEIYTEAGARAVDGVDGEVDVTTSGTVDTATPGEYLITYSVSDAAGNIATATRKIIVFSPGDTVMPVITMNDDSVIYLKTGDTYIEVGAVAVDAIGGDISVTTKGEVDTGTAGEYTIIYTATDATGNTATSTRKVIVTALEDENVPKITLNGICVIYLPTGEVYTDAGAVAVDDVDGNISVTTSGEVDTGTAGEYTITYTAIDSTGNTATAVRKVIVTAPKDTDAPLITLRGDSPLYLSIGDEYVDPQCC